jgi:hypothetical protein
MLLVLERKTVPVDGKPSSLDRESLLVLADAILMNETLILVLEATLVTVLTGTLTPIVTDVVAAPVGVL